MLGWCRACLWVALLCCCSLAFAQQESHSPVSLFYDNAQLRITSEPRGLDLKMTNYVYLDASATLPALGANQIKETTSAGEQRTLFPQQGVTLSACFISLKGQLTPRWSTSLEVEIHPKDVDFRTSYIGYAFSPLCSVKVGHLKVPGTMERNISTSQTYSISRAMSTALLSGRRVGAALLGQWKGFTTEVGVYGDELTKAMRQEGLSAEYLLGAKVAKGMELTQGNVSMLGVSFQYLRPHTAPTLWAVEATRELPHDEVPYLTVGYPNVAGVSTIAAEGAWQLGRLLLHAEWIGSSVSLAEEQPKPAHWLQGYTAKISYMIQGNPRTYKGETNDYRLDKNPKGKRWEASLRLSCLNLQNGTPLRTKAMSCTAETIYTPSHHMALCGAISYFRGNPLANAGGTLTTPNGKGPQLLSLYGRLYYFF